MTSDKTSNRMTTELGDSVAEQIVFIEAWLDAWKGDPVSQGAAHMARKVIATLRGADTPKPRLNNQAMEHQCPRCKEKLLTIIPPEILRPSAHETTARFQWKDGLPYINGMLANYDQLVTALRPSAQETTDQRNQAATASSGAEVIAPTPRGSLPNSLGTGGAGSHPAASSSPKASAPHEHVWQEMTTGGAQCSECRIVAGEWYCPKSPNHLCSYSKSFDSCDHCGLPEERK